MPFKMYGVGSVFPAVFLAAGHCNPALVATSSLSHACPNAAAKIRDQLMGNEVLLSAEETLEGCSHQANSAFRLESTSGRLCFCEGSPGVFTGFQGASD